MIKIVQVVSDTNIGGAGRYLLNYLKYYDRDKYSVTVILPQGSLLIPQVEKYKEVNLIPAPFMADKSYDRNCVKFLKKIFSDLSPDIVHTHASLSARIAARQAKTGKIVSTRHCLENVPTGIKAKAIGFLNNTLTDIYIAVADAVKDNLEQSGIPAEKIRTIYNGVEAVKEIPFEKKINLKSSMGIEEDETVFGIFARLEPVKGHKYFIKAARTLHKAEKKAKFLIVGAGSLENSLKKSVATYGIEDKIIFTGFIEDTTELLNIVDVNVISSESEAMSLSILEAMSLSKPTVATNVGGNSQLVQTGKTGVLVGPNDSTSLAEAMISLVDNKKLYEECSAGAKEEYENKFTAQRMVAGLEKLYRELC
ncbi:MAG: glycosyltransferase [Ruminococcaceae bacterium]|nr:glycosyltransferase [Oscillospiraceae bacterium]